jgi:predicted AAA+ superfamily ATPase
MTSKKPSKEPHIDVDSLNVDQRKAFDKLCNFLMSPDDSVYVIRGWAGTGKTYCVSLFVKYVLEIFAYGVGFILIIFIALGLFGAFDKDKDNPFKQ